MSLISKVKLPGHNTPYDIGVQWDNVKEKPDFYPAAAGIPYGEVDTSSTATVFTATIPGITELKDGVCMLLKNGVVTSASGFTININGLGAKPSYNNMTTGNDITPTDPTRDTTVFNINYTMLFIYSETIVSGGAWICYRGYDSDKNTDTIGYSLRTNATSMKTTAKFYNYRLLFTSADSTKWVPANTSTSTNATTKRDTIQTPINPFGEIVWYGTTTAIKANAVVTSAQLWQQYSGTYTAIGYSFNRTGAAATMTANAPIYIKCAPQADGSAIIDAEQPYVQTLPSEEDGKIYIFLGRAYSATVFELMMNHPVYQYKNGAIRLYTNADIPTKVSELTNDSGFLTASDNFGAIRIDSNAQPIPANAEQISPNNTIVLNKIAKTGSYTDLLNRPTNVSAFTNDANYINQTQLNTAISNVNQFNVQIVTSLPTANIDTHTIYFISNSGSGQNVYDEYMYLNNKWEKIGTTDVDLSGYLKKTDIAAWAKAVTKPTYTANEVGAITSADVATYQVQPDWNATSGKGQILNKPTIPAAPGTLNTNNTTAQTVSASEALSGTIKLHKISKTGNYNDLLNKPTIPTVPTKVSAFTNDSGYVKWDELWVYMES